VLLGRRRKSFGIFKKKKVQYRIVTKLLGRRRRSFGIFKKKVQ
jgi:hypothetical protein